MVGDYMNDVREIVFCFNSGSKLVPVDIAKSLSDRFKDLGNPVVLNPEGNNIQPLIVFKENPSMMVTMTQMTINMIIDSTFFEKIDTITFDLVDLFNDLGIKFSKMGIVYSIFLSNQHKLNATNKLIESSLIPDDVLEFNIAFYKQLKLKKEPINCWERLITNSEKFDDLLVQFDFNTENDPNRDINMKYIRDFIKLCDEYSEERIDF